MRKSSGKKKITKANKPDFGYDAGNMKITLFNSFEEMNEAEAKEAAAFTPVENLKMVTAYIKQVFAEELKEKMTDLTIRFKNNGTDRV